MLLSWRQNNTTTNYADYNDNDDNNDKHLSQSLSSMSFTLSLSLSLHLSLYRRFVGDILEQFFISSYYINRIIIIYCYILLIESWTRRSLADTRNNLHIFVFIKLLGLSFSLFLSLSTHSSSSVYLDKKRKNFLPRSFHHIFWIGRLRVSPPFAGLEIFTTALLRIRYHIFEGERSSFSSLL